MGKNKKLSLQVYVNEEFGDIRAVMIDDEPWLVAVDVCNALEIGNPSQALTRLKNNEKMTITNNEGHSGKRGGAQKLNLVNEPGLYRLIFTSRKAEAEKFQNWVYHEVLPSIRKTGAYVADKDYQKFLQVQQNYLKARHDETDTIKVFIEYARHQGCSINDGFFYGLLSKWVNLGVGLPERGGRDKADIPQKSAITLLEGTVIKNILINGMADKLHWTQTWAKVQQQINLFLEVTFQIPKLLG